MGGRSLDLHAVSVPRPEVLHVRQYVLQKGEREGSGTVTTAEGGGRGRRGALTRGWVVGR